MRCEAITLAGTQCSRTALSNSRYCWQHQKLEQKLIKDYISSLPNVIYPKITEYNTYAEIIKFRTVSLKVYEFSNLLFLYKSCVIMDNVSIKSFSYLHNLNPNLKQLNAMSLDITDLMHVENNFYNITPISDFKKLESLAIRIPYYGYPVLIKTIVNWKLLKHLRYLNLNFFPEKISEIYEVFEALPSLQHFAFDDYIEVKEDVQIPLLHKNLTTLEFRSEYYFPILKFFPTIPRIITFYVQKNLIQDLPNLKNLEVLECEYFDDLEFNYEYLSYFPKTLKFFQMRFIEYSVSDMKNYENKNGYFERNNYTPQIFSLLDFSKLEYLMLFNIRSFIQLLKTVSYFPKLKHVYLKEIYIVNFSKEDLTILTEFKTKYPNLTLDFDVVLTSSSILPEINSQYILDLQKIFNFSNLYPDQVNEDNGFYKSLKSQYLPSVWFQAHNYYVNEECGDILYLSNNKGITKI